MATEELLSGLGAALSNASSMEPSSAVTEGAARRDQRREYLNTIEQLEAEIEALQNEIEMQQAEMDEDIDESVVRDFIAAEDSTMLQSMKGDTGAAAVPKFSIGSLVGIDFANAEWKFVNENDRQHRLVGSCSSVLQFAVSFVSDTKNSISDVSVDIIPEYEQLEDALRKDAEQGNLPAMFTLMSSFAKLISDRKVALEALKKEVGATAVVGFTSPNANAEVSFPTGVSLMLEWNVNVSPHSGHPEQSIVVVPQLDPSLLRNFPDGVAKLSTVSQQLISRHGPLRGLRLLFQALSVLGEGET